jgi:hypothetical protein
MDLNITGYEFKIELPTVQVNIIDCFGEWKMDQYLVGNEVHDGIFAALLVNL